MAKSSGQGKSTSQKNVRTDSTRQRTSGSVKDMGKTASGGAKDGTSSTGPRKR